MERRRLVAQHIRQRERFVDVPSTPCCADYEHPRWCRFHERSPRFGTKLVYLSDTVVYEGTLAFTIGDHFLGAVFRGQVRKLPPTRSSAPSVGVVIFTISVESIIRSFVRLRSFFLRPVLPRTFLLSLFSQEIYNFKFVILFWKSWESYKTKVRNCMTDSMKQNELIS